MLLPSARSNDVVRVPSLSRHPSHPCFLRFSLPPPYVPSSYLLVAAPDTLNLSQAADPQVAAELVSRWPRALREPSVCVRVWERLLGSDAPSIGNSEEPASAPSRNRGVDERSAQAQAEGERTTVSSTTESNTAVNNTAVGVGPPKPPKKRHGGARAVAAWARALCWVGSAGFEGWEACAASILDHADASGSAHLLLASLRHLGQFGPKTLMKVEGRVEGRAASGASYCRRRRAASSLDEGEEVVTRLPPALHSLLLQRYGEGLTGGTPLVTAGGGVTVPSLGGASGPGSPTSHGAGVAARGAEARYELHALPLAVMPFEPLWVSGDASIRAVHSELRALCRARSAAHRPLRVGIDTEWMDGEGEGALPLVAVVQLAVEQKAWVIDALPRADEEEGDTRSALGGLLRWLLDEADASDVTLLGFAFAGDMAVLRPLIGASPPHCSPTQCPRNLIDVQALARLRGEDTPSLKKVCARTIGQRLDKTEQCSDWGRRPLRREQLRYAALDALILIFVHDSLVSKASSH